MVTFKQLTLSTAAAAILLTGCSTKVENAQPKVKKNIIQEFQEKIDTKKKFKMKNSLPPLMLPSVYEEPTIMSSGKTINFSATNAPLSKLLYVISKEAGLNLVIDEDLNVSKPITLNMKDAPLQDALDITMNISNSYVEVQGNIMHVKKIMTRTFEIPYINMSPATNSALGGDLLGANEQTSGLAGDYSLEYASDKDKSDFYLQIENSLGNILSENGKFSINKFSGTLVVTDHRKNIQQVEKVIENLKKFIGKQVLIEAKIMEVILNNEHQLGVNWQKSWADVEGGALSLGQNMNDATAAFGTTGLLSPLSGGIATTMAYTTESFNGLIQAMETAGSIEVVSNPRLKVMNGQSGVLSSGSMIPYWTKEVTSTAVTNPTTGVTSYTNPETTYEKTDVLNGISLGVMPIIKENGEVLLNVIPVVTSIEGDKTVVDASGEVARAPIINVKEAGTTILTKDNDMIVIGGLISSVKKDYEYKTPGLGDIPWLGNLFKRTEKKVEKRELVIILKIDVDERK